MKRIDPQAIPALFEKLRLKPEAGRIQPSGDPCTCLIGALLIAETGLDDRLDDSLTAVLALQKLGYSNAYLWGLTRGFDTGHEEVAPPSCEDPSVQGVRDGAAARNVLIKKGMLVP